MNLSTQDDHSQRILRVLVHIQRDLDVPHTLESLAEVACFSRYHFHRVFAAFMGETVMAHLRRLRLERAAQRLLSTRNSIIELALDAGYETPEAFTRAFRAQLGCSPSAFRKAGKRPAAASPSGIHYDPGAVPKWTPVTYGGKDMEIRIETRAPKRVAFVRHTGPYAECEGAWGRLCGWAGPKGLLGPKSEFLGVSYDDPAITASDNIRYDACVVVGDNIEPQGDVGVQTLEGGEYAVAVHEGPYENFQRSYNHLYGQWLPENGWACRDEPCYEVYLNDPNTTPPEDLRTLICVPVKKA